MEWLVAPLLSLLGVVAGWVAGRRKIAGEVESLSVAASKVAVDSLLLTVEPLRDEIRELKGQMRGLRAENSRLAKENVRLTQEIAKLRLLLQQWDIYPPYRTTFRDDQPVGESE